MLLISTRTVVNNYNTKSYNGFKKSDNNPIQSNTYLITESSEVHAVI